MLEKAREFDGAKTHNSKKRVLLVDDSPLVLAMVGEMLEGLNYCVITATDGQEALKCLEVERCDLIITDLKMPVMNGIEFAASVKKNSAFRFTPVIMLSSEEDDDMIARAKQMGVSTFLRKPIKKQNLDTILRLVIGS